MSASEAKQPTRLEKLEALYDITIDNSLKMAIEQETKLSTYSGALPKIKQCLDMERDETGVYSSKNLVIEFTDSPAVADDE